MAVDEPRVIDLLGVNKNTGEIDLTISDHLDWIDSEQHQLVLQEKLNTYLAFVESGELLEQVFDAESRSVVFNIVFKFAPDTRGTQFLVRCKEAIEAAGCGLRWRLFEDFEMRADSQRSLNRLQ